MTHLTCPANGAKVIDYYERVLALSRDIGDTDGQALGWEHLGQTYLALGRRGHARHAWLRALDLYRTQHRTAQVDRVHQQLATFDVAAKRSV
jgi:tetratricopeptide (TPR) repeat protein